MKTHIKDTILFLLPLILIVVFPFCIFYFSGEFAPLQEVFTKIRSKEPILYGKAYLVDSDSDFKLPLMIEIAPDVLVLGNSRVLQFRSGFFTQGTSFFNGGRLIDSFLDFKRLIELLPKDKKPKVVIVGLDFHLFNPVNDFLYTGMVPPPKNTLKDELINGLRSSYFDLFSGKYTLGELNEVEDKDGVFRIGLKARAHDEGFRNDGSYYYGKVINDPDNPHNEDYHFQDTLRRIDRGTQSFEKGKDVSTLAVQALADFLLYAKQNNIHVIGFHEPYAPTVYDAILAKGDEYAYMFKIDPVIRSLFSNYGASLFDFSDIRSLGSSDKEFIDGWHGGEKAYLRLFIEMVKKDPTLEKFTDLKLLQSKLQTEKSDFDIFKNEL